MSIAQQADDRRIVIGFGTTRVGLLFHEGRCVGVMIRDERPRATIGQHTPDNSPLDARDTMLIFANIEGARVVQDAINHAILHMTDRTNPKYGPQPIEPAHETFAASPSTAEAKLNTRAAQVREALERINASSRRLEKCEEGLHAEADPRHADLLRLYINAQHSLGTKYPDIEALLDDRDKLARLAADCYEVLGPRENSAGDIDDDLRNAVQAHIVCRKEAERLQKLEEELATAESFRLNFEHATKLEREEWGRDSERLNWLLQEADVVYWWDEPRKHDRPSVRMETRQEIDAAMDSEGLLKPAHVDAARAHLDANKKEV